MRSKAMPTVAILAAFLFSWRLAHAQPRSAPPAVGAIAQVGYDDELRSRTIKTRNGTITIEVSASAEAAIREIHRERGAYYATLGKSVDTMVRSDAKMRAQISDSSLFFRLNDKGTLLGLLELTGQEHQPIRIMAADLDDKSAARVVFSGARDRGGRILAFVAFDAAGKIVSIGRIAAFEARVTTMD